MSGLANALKLEIRRLARKELKSELAATRKASTQYRKDIVALKRQLREQAKEIRSLKRGTTPTARHAADVLTNARFSPKWLQAHRDKLELSASDYAALVGVSGQTIYNWEHGKTRPQQQQLKAWTVVRSLGKREAWKRLEAMD